MGASHEHPQDADQSAGLRAPTVLLVDADATEADRLRAQLAVHGAYAIVCPDGAEALMTVGSYSPDMVLLGRDVPVIGGPTFLRVLRRRHHMPVIVGVDRDGAQDAASLLAAGATACVAWPFGVHDVLGMLPTNSGATHRRRANQDQVLTVGDVRIDIAGHDVHVGSERLKLPLREFQLLVLLARNADRVLPRDLIIDALWGTDDGRDTNTLAVHIRRLRHRLQDDPHDPHQIVTIRGVGYRLNATRTAPGADQPPVIAAPPPA